VPSEEPFLIQVPMYYRSGTGVWCCLGTSQMLCVRSPDGSTFLKVWRQIENPTKAIEGRLLQEQSGQVLSVPLNNASDYWTSWLYRTHNPNPNPSLLAC